jgi:hypothetical protein
MRRIVLGAFVAAIASSAGMAKDISCTGVLIDVDIDPRMAFPYAVVYDADNYRTCMLDRGPAGHDPLRGICNQNEKAPSAAHTCGTYVIPTSSNSETAGSM